MLFNIVVWITISLVKVVLSLYLQKYTYENAKIRAAPVKGSKRLINLLQTVDSLLLTGTGGRITTCSEWQDMRGWEIDLQMLECFSDTKSDTVCFFEGENSDVLHRQGKHYFCQDNWCNFPPETWPFLGIKVKIVPD